MAPSRERAQDAIRAGRVVLRGAIADKPSRRVAPDDSIELRGDGPRFVSRGGDKLDAALEQFGVDPRGRRAIDCGASTGGFTDAMLQRGAAEVVALDVGTDQLHAKLLADPRVRSFERTTIRGIDPARLGGKADLVVADLSFISVELVVADLLRLCLPNADLVVLVKPQFEAGRAEVRRSRGIVSDPAAWLRALEGVHDTLVSQGAAIMGAMVSPLFGSDGNVEFLLHARAPMLDEAPADPTESSGFGKVRLGDLVAEAAALRDAHG